MNLPSYLRDAEVPRFIDWASRIVGGDEPLSQKYDRRNGRGPEWECASLGEAYGKFEWSYSTQLPDEHQRRRGSSLGENMDVLDRLRSLLRQSRLRNDVNGFYAAATATLDWGGIRNSRKLPALGTNALRTLCLAADQLDPASADTGKLEAVTQMNSGFSKVYSLLLDRFPIYDSRVACALASLVHKYCHEKKLPSVPVELAFGLPTSRNPDRRDPSCSKFNFPRLLPGDAQHYAISNLRSAWLLGKLAKQPFCDVPGERRVLALQSALFMIGYQRLPKLPVPEGCTGYRYPVPAIATAASSS